MLRSPHLTGVVILAGFFAILSRVWNTEEKKTYRLRVPFQTQQEEKAKEVMFQMTTNYDFTLWCAFAIMWLEGFVENPSFVPLCSLCSVAKFCYCFDWLTFY